MKKDIAIIGGSAAGFFTASLLAQKGLPVRIFETSDSIAPSPRTLIVTSHISDLTGSLGEGTVINKIRQYELFADGRFATISLGRPDLVIERSELIRQLATRAQESGAEILTGRHFLSFKPNGKRLSFAVSSNGDGELVEESTDILIGADGAFSKVAQSAGCPTQPTVPLFQAIVRLPKDMPSDATRVWFIPEDTPYFYWLIPYSPTHGVLGLIGEKEKRGQRSLTCFLERRNLIPLEIQSARIPLHTHWFPIHRRIGQSHVYLVGDAAGHVKMSTVGGLVTGFRGALGVAEAILNGGSSRQSKALRLELDLHWLIRKVLNRFSQADYAKLLDLLTPSVKHSLGLFNRDETGKLLLNVFFKEPRLLLLGLRSLLIGR